MLAPGTCHARNVLIGRTSCALIPSCSNFGCARHSKTLKYRTIEIARFDNLLVASAGALNSSPSSRPPATGPSPSFAAVWDESPLWKEAVQTSCGDDPAARAALGRSLEGLYTLLPDLRPHWREQLAVHAKLVQIEALVCGGRGETQPPPPEVPPEGPAAAVTSVDAGAATGGADVADAGPAAAGAAAAGGGDSCLFAGVQAAFAEVQSMKPLFKSYGTRTIALYHSRSMWALSEALMQAPARFVGPGRPLLTAQDLGQAGAELRALRRSHTQHLEQLVQAQLDLSRRLPELARLLVLLRQERPEAGVNVSRKVATNLLLLQQSLSGEGQGEGDARRTLDSLSLILEMEAQEAWRRAARGP